MPKCNVTVSIDEDAYRLGRIWAAENDSTISAVVSYCIERLPHLPAARRAVDSIHRQRNSMVELTQAVERLSVRLSASAKNKNTHCENVQPDNPEQPQLLAPGTPQRDTEKEAQK